MTRGPLWHTENHQTDDSRAEVSAGRVEAGVTEGREAAQTLEKAGRAPLRESLHRIACLLRQSRPFRHEDFTYVGQARPLILAKLESTRIEAETLKRKQAGNRNLTAECIEVTLHTCTLDNTGSISRPKDGISERPFSTSAARLRRFTDASKPPDPERCKITGIIGALQGWMRMRLLAFQRSLAKPFAHYS